MVRLVRKKMIMAFGLTVAVVGGAGGMLSCANPQSSRLCMSTMRICHDGSPSTTPTMR